MLMQIVASARYRSSMTFERFKIPVKLKTDYVDPTGQTGFDLRRYSTRRHRSLILGCARAYRLEESLSADLAADAIAPPEHVTDCDSSVVNLC